MQMISDALLGEENLRKAISEIGPPESGSESVREWLGSLTQNLARIKAADRSERSTAEFQQFLWEKNRVADPGQGNISVSAALDDAPFREWLADRSMTLLPSSSTERIRFLNEFYEDLKSRLEAFVPQKTPHLKIFRVLAALYPEAMTTIADRGALINLGRMMNPDRSLRDVALHVWIRERIDAITGASGTDVTALAASMIVPWLLYARYCRTGPSDSKPPSAETGKPRLHPLPAVQRLRSLSSIPERFAGILEILEFVGDGVTTEVTLPPQNVSHS